MTLKQASIGSFGGFSADFNAYSADLTDCAVFERVGKGVKQLISSKSFSENFIANFIANSILNLIDSEEIVSSKKSIQAIDNNPTAVFLELAILNNLHS